MTMILHHQNLMIALREEMGWPSFRPANDCISWASGQEFSFDVGNELARVAQMAGRDVIYTGWASARAKDPTSIAIAYREMLTIDVVDNLVPFAASDRSPIILVSTHADEFFAIDRRGSLARVAGKPKGIGIGKGKALAMKRIKASASTMGDELLANNQFVPPGADWIEPEAPFGAVVRFG
ncbi:hypothetical protein [uncultured Sphingomonas sp.]|uniref:hypothetical protein n=1 Tax=uncultured Sphingomonas sp. TaxID=158754 RepID=UPI0025E6DEA1|nr:hypothetical protein [uncultured Sphingomonas sp.]